MWPKAFAQLIELAPHISRLLPMADRFFQSKNAADESGRRATEAAVEELRSGLHADMGQIAAAQAGLSQQIGALGEGMAAVSTAARDARTAAEAVGTRCGEMETRLGGVESRLGGIEARLDRMTDRVRLSPVVSLLVLTNLILLASLLALLLRGH